MALRRNGTRTRAAFEGEDSSRQEEDSSVPPARDAWSAAGDVTVFFYSNAAAALAE